MLKQNPRSSTAISRSRLRPTKRSAAAIEKFDIDRLGSKVCLHGRWRAARRHLERNLVGTNSDSYVPRQIDTSGNGERHHGQFGVRGGRFSCALSEIPESGPKRLPGRVGFIHPYVGNLDVETSTIKILIRDFDLSGIAATGKDRERDGRRQRKNVFQK